MKPWNDPDDAAVWRCPHCKEVTVCITIGRTADKKPVIRCAQCDNTFEVGKSGMMEEAKDAKIVVE